MTDYFRLQVVKNDYAQLIIHPAVPLVNPMIHYRNVVVLSVYL